MAAAREYVVKVHRREGPCRAAHEAAFVTARGLGAVHAASRARRSARPNQTTASSATQNAIGYATAGLIPSSGTEVASGTRTAHPWPFVRSHATGTSSISAWWTQRTGEISREAMKTAR